MAEEQTKIKKERGRKNEIIGRVVSDKMNKTITVEADHTVRHVKYGKYLRRTSTFKVHDERNEARIGDTVKIAETRPLSKTKRWKLEAVMEKARLAQVVQT